MLNFTSKIHTFLIPRHYWDDEEELRKAKMLVNALMLSALFGSFYFFNTILFDMPNIMYNMIFCICAFLLLLVLFKYGISRTITANLFSAVALLCTGYDIYFSQGLFSWSFAWLSMSPVLALLLMNKKYGYVWLGASAIMGIIIGLLSLKGYPFPNDINLKYYSLMTLNAGIGIILIMFFIALVLDNASNRSLERLNQKNQEIQWEKALAEQERKRAEQSEKLKQQFLANMSHEIRTPMNAIMGLTSILLEKNPTPQQLNHLKIIQKNSETLHSIINDVLDLSKIEAGKIELEHIGFDLKELIEITRQTFEHKAGEKGLTLNVIYDDTIPPTLTGDPTRLSQVLINLLSNALKFTHEGEVTLKVEKGEGASVHFTVSDTGIGMTPEQLELVFEPFRQADAGTTRKYGGTGLGLYIARQLVNVHHSELYVESIPGKGSTFSFTIKYPDNIPATGKKREIVVTEKMLKEMTGLKVLLAEDNEFNRIVATETLELKIPGVAIDIAMNGIEAVDKAPGHDLVLMDVHMPEMDGYEATKRIRNKLSPPYNSIPVIALTASVIESDYSRCTEAGMNAVVPKPFNVNTLLLTLYNVLYAKDLPVNEMQPGTYHPEKEPQRISNIETLAIFCENNQERIKKYISIYLAEAPKNIVNLNKYLKEKDCKNLKLVAHTLKTHFKYMGMKTAIVLAEDIEKVCKGSQDTETLENLIDKLESICEQSYIELTEYV